MKAKELIIANIFYSVLFVAAIYIFNPSAVEGLAFNLIIMSWLFYMVATFMTILTFAIMPFTKFMMSGQDKEFGVGERKTAVYLFGMIAIAMAILLSNVIPNILIAAYSTSV